MVHWGKTKPLGRFCIAKKCCSLVYISSSINISYIYKSYRTADLNFNERESHRDSNKRPSRFLLVMNFHLASLTHIYACLRVCIIHRIDSAECTKGINDSFSLYQNMCKIYIRRFKGFLGRDSPEKIYNKVEKSTKCWLFEIGFKRCMFYC